jgi:hypothetical protein
VGLTYLEKLPQILHTLVITVEKDVQYALDVDTLEASSTLSGDEATPAPACTTVIKQQ